MNKKQQHPPVVVVFEKLVWEKPIEENQKTACEILLAAAELPPEIRQKFADEMGGEGRREPIRNPAGWLKNMLWRYGQGGFSFAYADVVAAARSARAAQAARESLVLPAPPARLAGAPPRELSDVGREALAAARELLKRRKLSTA